MFELLNTCILFCALLNSCMFRMQVFAFARRLNIFVEMKNFQNTISDRGLISVFQLDAAMSPMECSRLCLRYPNCRSYFENVVTRECRLMSEILTEDEMSKKEDETWQYFGKYLI